jgi:hypothetical protein
MIVGDFIINGVGDCTAAFVDKQHRLHTKATTVNALDTATENERAFGILTADITLTNDTESALLYICNSETSKIVVDKVLFGIGASDGTGLPQSVIYVDPEGGTIISEKNPAIVVNFDSGSSITLDGLFYKGGEGKTFVGTGLPNSMFVQAPGYSDSFPKFTLGTGSCSGFAIIPPPGNTSMIVNINLYVYLRDFV